MVYDQTRGQRAEPLTTVGRQVDAEHLLDVCGRAARVAAECGRVALGGRRWLRVGAAGRRRNHGRLTEQLAQTDRRLVLELDHLSARLRLARRAALGRRRQISQGDLVLEGRLDNFKVVSRKCTGC